MARDDLRSTQLLIGNGPPPAEGKLMFDGSPNGASWVLCVPVLHVFLIIMHVPALEMITEEHRSPVVALRTGA